jgi:hypothetical protein
MKNILILADGPIAKHFLEWISKRKITQNQYHVAFYKEGVLSEKIHRDITAHFCDPTSYSKLLKLMSTTRFSEVFIVMNSYEDSKYSLKNIRQINDKVLVVMLDNWNSEFENLHNLTIVNQNQLMASHLYDHLPNVPVIAQNVGLGEGEIMEMSVPFGSSYAYRHVGSIAQRKWKIAAIYRDKKQIIPTSATMVRPNDILLTLGKPMVLDGVYRSINKRRGLFPEPFGKDLYLLLDMSIDEDRALVYFYESIYIANKLDNKELYIRIINPSNFSTISALKEEQSNNVSIHIYYDSIDINEIIEYDIQNFNIGLVINSLQTFNKYNLESQLFELKKLVYIFGNRSLYNITDCIILMSNEAQMESISSTSFDLAESFNFKLKICHFSPNADFDNTKKIIEHYETLSQIFNHDISVIEKIANPIRKLRAMENVLQIVPFTYNMQKPSLFQIFSTKVEDYLLSVKQHPKILVPIESVEGINI